MRNLQQNVLIIVALSLCGLCVYQWYGQTVQRNEIQKLEQTVYEQSAAIQGYTNSIKTMDRQIAQMDARITQLKLEVKTNTEFIITQKREINRLRAAAAGLTNQVAEYKLAVEKYKLVVESLQGKLKDAYDGIQKQNAAMKELVAQRDEFVQKFNESVKARNDVVAKYNDLVAQVEKLQGAKK